MTTQGRRVERIRDLYGPDGEGVDGGYVKVTSGGKTTWVARTPNGHVGNLSAHDVTENPDGTITVTPSILVSDHTGELYHGFLTDGVWEP